MQKINKKASILIWAIFLSLIISISFLNISTKITKNLKNNDINNIEISKQSDIKNILETSENNNDVLGNNIIYIENKTLKNSLKKDEKYIIDFSTDSIINLSLISSGVIFYEFISTIPSSGILNNNNLKLENFDTGIGKLELTNLSGYVSFKMTSDNKFEITEKKYKITENIGNKTIIKSRGIIK